MNRSLLLPAFCLLIALILIVPRNPASPPGVVFAQDKTKCDLKGVAAKLIAFKLTDDAKKDMDALLKIQGDISAANVACNGLTFSGKGANVTDPFDIGKGTYRVRLQVKDSKALHASIESIGDKFCGASLLADKPADRLDARDGCRATLQIDTYDEEAQWTVTLEPLK